MLGSLHCAVQVTVAMCALTLSLNLSCLLVCAIQFLFAAKLVKTSQGRLRSVLGTNREQIFDILGWSGWFGYNISCLVPPH